MIDLNKLPPQWQQWWIKQQSEDVAVASPDDPDAVFDEETIPVLREEDPNIEAKLDQMFGIESRPH